MAYDQDELKVGYKGKFVIHRHEARNLHWDIRLEFPVKSVKESLKTYEEKRHWEDEKKTNEPKPSTEGKSVLRSWAIPKHKEPGASPVLAVETEDHEMKYKDFEGEIPEGHYGAGKVDIYDDGTFEILKIDYDKKYTIKFNGRKLKGVYTLLKIGEKKFLWIKPKDQQKYESEQIIASVLKQAKKQEMHEWMVGHKVLFWNKEHTKQLQEKITKVKNGIGYTEKVIKLLLKI